MHEQANKTTIPELPHMEPEGIEIFKRHLNSSNCYLEFGAGASTVMAAKLGVKNITSVDSSKEWVEIVKSHMPKDSTSIYNIIHCNIGAIQKWGRPLNSDEFKNYHNYVVSPWNFLLDHKLSPDLILIDGRFRVLSFLYSYIMAPNNTTILFDDYVNRQHYHIIEDFCKPVDTYGRMAKFKTNKNHETIKLLPLLLQSVSEYE